MRPLTLLAAILAPLAALAATPVVLNAGDPQAAHVTLTFTPRAETAVTIDTLRAGVPGSLFSVYVDRASRPVLTLTLTDEHCRFNDSGSACKVALRRGDPAVARLESAFRAGRVGRITVETGGTMAMDRNISLIGFTRALAAAR